MYIAGKETLLQAFYLGDIMQRRVKQTNAYLETWIDCRQTTVNNYKNTLCNNTKGLKTSSTLYFNI
jgi:hypothetical protein